tara:strand:- start:6749 stop:8548 length:1800 start_codon:yes stop_codon:yes gene_type:complete
MKLEEIEQPSRVEQIKHDSNGLRLPSATELSSDALAVSEEACQLLKFHGTYQQDNRDTRIARKRSGLDKDYSFMVRNRIPGGRLTAKQFLAELDLAEQFGNGTIRLTTRQSIQIHGVLKNNLRDVIHAINRIGLSTQSACGDVNRNVMCCPAPLHQNAVRKNMLALADQLADILRPRTQAYNDLWVTDPDTGEKTNHLASAIVEEPLYGALYLPRKFKVGIALCDDNCIDVYDQDIGLLGITDGDSLLGYNILAGGSMGTTPSDPRCFPALAKRLAFVTPEQVAVVASAIVLVQRDHGDRSDRRQARMKYLIHRWGLERFREAVVGRLEEAAATIGADPSQIPDGLAEPHPDDVRSAPDHLGWHEQGDGNRFLGIPIENGRIKDEDNMRLKKGLREIFTRFEFGARITAQQNLLIADIPPSQCREVQTILSDHGINTTDDLKPLRRRAFACPALPTCGLALTESERVLPRLVGQLQTILDDLKMGDLELDLRMTGCPNGCARPYNAEIGLVGSGHNPKSGQGKYTVFLGGSPLGNRLNSVFREKVLFDEIPPLLRPILQHFADHRNSDESFGDFCHRLGLEQLRDLSDGPLEGNHRSVS